MRNFLRENWLYIVVPLALVVAVLVVLILTGSIEMGTRYNIM